MNEPDTVETVPATEPTKPPRRRNGRKQRVWKKPDMTPFKVGEALPNMMNGIELCRALNIKPNTFDDLQSAGKFKQFEFRKPLQEKRRYSGLLVTKYLQEPR